MEREDVFSSSSESESQQPTQFEEIIYKKERPRKKPDRKGMTKAQLDVRMKNLEKARQARLANLQKRKAKKKYSSDDSSSEEYVISKTKGKGKKKNDASSSRLDNIEKMMHDLYKAQMKAHKSKVVEKQIITQVPSQAGGQKTPQMTDLARSILF